MLLSIVIPVLNEAETIPTLLGRLRQCLIDFDWEVVFVDDGSADTTPKVLEIAANEDPRVHVIRFSRNFGHQAAVTAGLDFADGDAVVVMDADLQDPPELLPRLIELFLQGFDIVSPQRISREAETLFKQWTARIFYRMVSRMTSQRLAPDVGDFRLFSRRAVLAIRSLREQHRYMRGLAAWLGLREVFVPFERQARAGGSTKYSLIKMLRFAWTAISSFSTLPLRISISAGCLLSFVGFIYLLQVLYLKFWTNTLVPGWASVVALQCIFSGMILLALGAIGDYVARIFEESKNRPLYVVTDLHNVSISHKSKDQLTRAVILAEPRFAAQDRSMPENFEDISDLHIGRDAKAASRGGNRSLGNKMFLLPPPSKSPSVLAVEGAMTAIAVGIAFCMPRIGSSVFAPIERWFGELARRRRLSTISVGLIALLLRLALLPIHPIPYPFNTDDFSFLFAADTFAHGRLTNPRPAMWTHFETMHITMNPTYASMFFPGQGLVLAVGKVLFGHPWFGLLCTAALMCAAVCWMLQAWLPPTWALLGGLLVILRIGVFSYWIDTYTGAGLLTALGGALVLGALPRLKKDLRMRDAMLLAIGILVLANSRPFEGLLLCLPVACALGYWLFAEKNRPSTAAFIRALAPALVLVVAAGVWMAYYNYRNFGSPLTLPYSVDRAAYAVAPHFIWGSPNTMPVYRYKAIHDYYIKIELPEFQKIHSISGFLPQTILKEIRIFSFFAAFALIPPLIMVRRVFLDRRIRFLLICVLILILGLTAEAGIRPYYLGPFTAAIYALGLQAMRHLRQWKPGDQPVGATMLRFIILICLCTAALDIWAQPLHLGPTGSPGISWACDCLRSPQPGSERAMIETELEKLPNRQLVLVRYTPDHDAGDEWVYNSADIDGSKVIWAREMDSDQDKDKNAELIRYYNGRQVWLVQPDATPATLSPYPMSREREPIASATH